MGISIVAYAISFLTFIGAIEAFGGEHLTKGIAMLVGSAFAFIVARYLQKDEA